LPGAGQDNAEQGDEARRKLETVRVSLHRMAELVETAMKGASGAIASRSLLPAAPIELGEAIFHAVDVLTPLAHDHGVRIKACVSNGLGGVPAGSLYPVVVNGLRNAIEAVAAAGRRPDAESQGSVDVSAGWTEDGRVRIAIRDDGVGLPNAATEAIFRFGFTTKPGGAGVGLAVARAIVDELPDGSLRLFSRADRPGTTRPGAIFEVMFRPSPRDAAGTA
jgi:signal transduction histidine kinase